ncbi:MAG TPA: ABC transporter permease [Candidatus Paceibacterota bacterium]|nr:ABC transporter permease [Candidatus Paceibacterota bacterium]
METIIKPQRQFSWTDIAEIWRYRELLYFLTWRDIKVRYKQTVIGIGWGLFQPFVTMVVFSVVFGHFGQIPSDNVPYPIFVFVGLLLWQFFSSSLNDASNSLITNQSIVTKVYFPRLLLPVSVIITNLVDFLISTCILIGLMIYYGYLPHLSGFLLFPFLLLITICIALGGGMILASFNVKYRDLRYALPFFIQIMLFITPVIYSPSILEKYSWILAVNPMTGVIKAARAAILGATPINWELLAISGGGAAVLLIAGVLLFKKTEQNFADLI